MLRQILVRLGKHKTKKNLRSTGFPNAIAILAETSVKQINTPRTLMPAEAQMGAQVCFSAMFKDGMAGVTGLEPAASGVTGQRSNQLSYTPNPIVTEEPGAHRRAIVYVRTWLVSSPMVVPRSGQHSCVSQVYQPPELWKDMVGGDGIEPPTLSV